MWISLVISLAVIFYVTCCQMPSRFWIYTVYHANCQVCDTSKELRFLTNASASSLGDQISRCKSGIPRHLYLGFFDFSFMMKNSGLFMLTENISDFKKNPPYYIPESHHIIECDWSSAKARNSRKNCLQTCFTISVGKALYSEQFPIFVCQNFIIKLWEKRVWFLY